MDLYKNTLLKHFKKAIKNRLIIAIIYTTYNILVSKYSAYYSSRQGLSNEGSLIIIK